MRIHPSDKDGDAELKPERFWERSGPSDPR